MGCLRYFRGGGFASADGPNWLVSEDDLAPVSNYVLDGS